VHVADPAHPLVPEDAACLQANLELAEDLNVEVLTVQDKDIVAALARVAQERRITQIVLGTRQRSRWQEFLRPTTARRLSERVAQDLHLVRPPSRQP
jgi:two-component system sensor histidine kinase KdpD